MGKMTARLVGWGKFLPEQRIDNATLIREAGVANETGGGRLFNFYNDRGEVAKAKEMTPEAIVKTTGIHERRWARDDEHPDDFAISVAGEAIRRSGLGPDTVWRGIFVHSVHRLSAYPSIAQRIQHEFGLTIVDGYAEDCSSACAGYTQQLQKIYDLMQGNPGPYLVVGAEVMSRITPRDDINFDLWGDAAGATVWVPGEQNQPGSMVAVDSSLLTRGAKGDIDPIAMIREHQKSRTSREKYGHMLMPFGPNVVRFVRRHVGDTIRNLLRKANWTGGSRLVLILHQANYNILKFFPDITRKMYDGEVVSYMGIVDTGNASSASTAYGLSTCLDGPDGITENEIHIQPDDRCLVIGFGSGMSIHGVAIQF